MRVSWCWFWEARPLLFFMGAKRCLSQFETRYLVEYPFSISAIFRKSRHQRHQPRLYQHRSALCITRNMNVIIPPHPTPPINVYSTAYRCQRARTLHQHRNALCITRNMNVITPPHPTPPINVALRTDVSVHEHYINIAVRCASRVTWTLSSHPTPPHETMIYVVKNAQNHAVPMGKAHKNVRVYRSTEPPTKATWWATNEKSWINNDARCTQLHNIPRQLMPNVFDVYS